MEHPCDFHVIIPDAKKDCVWSCKRGSQPWHQLFARASRQRSLGDPPGGLIDCA
jgi:hypothetical protein